MKLIFALHCETDWNDPVNGYLQGHIDTELNDYGRNRAENLGKALREADIGISKIISSDLKRAHETALIISTHLNIPVDTDSRLRECKFGSLEGRSKIELAEYLNAKEVPPHWPGSFKEYDFRHLGGENRDEVLARHLAVIDEIRNSYGGETVLIVGHGAGLNTIFSEWSLEMFPRGEYKVVEV